MSKFILPFLLFGVLCWSSCGEGEVIRPDFRLISVTLNGSDLGQAGQEVPLETEVDLVFSAAVDPVAFERNLSVMPDPNAMAFAYSGQSSRVSVRLNLTPDTDYALALPAVEIGAEGQRLTEMITASFRSEAGRSAADTPCTTADAGCRRQLDLGAGAGTDYLSSFDLEAGLVPLTGITAAVIVIHGANRDADNYFRYLTNSLRGVGQTDSVVLLAPYFREEATAEATLTWSGNGWRAGANAGGASGISSFTIVDELVDLIAGSDRFPDLDEIIITGHSSGALFTLLYAAANDREGRYPGVRFRYLPANSQYYYYADGRRVDESNGRLYTPADCAGYDVFPQGFAAAPPYLAGTDRQTFNDRYLERSVRYLLGNGTGPDPTLNTEDCFVTLLGSTRYQRGENLFTYLELAFPGAFAHERTIIEGVGHDGRAVYASPEFAALLAQLLGD
jgi:pimeloyl-ACP methyl ester carboxylesterase